MKFLVSNDDGINADGIGLLAEVASDFGEVVVVAPDRQYSGCGHLITVDAPLKVVDHGGGRYECNGTPADCVRIGLRHIATDVDLVLSGINHGGNLGIDTAMSGTVAAVREGLQLGKPGIAFSQFLRQRDGAFDWTAPREAMRTVLANLLERDLPAGWLWNVNLPDPKDQSGTPEIVDCRLEPGHHAFEFEHDNGTYHHRSLYHERTRTEGSDVDVCFSGRIAVSCLPAMWSA